MSEWSEYRLGDLYNVSSGLSKAADQFGFGHTFISFKDVFWNFFIPEKPEGLVNSNEKEQKSCNVSRGDILITRTSESLEEVGMTSVALKDYPNSTFNGFSKRLRPKENPPIEVSPLFMGYLLRTRFFRKSVANYATMTTRASLNGESIKSIPLLFPSIDTQEEIGKTLYSLDQKITLLREQNQTLEELAQTLFKRWFVEFEFPNEDGDPYKSSGGKLVESELGEIPEGWSVGNVKDLIQIPSGHAFKSKNFVSQGKYKLITIKNVQDGIVDTNKTECISNLPSNLKKHCVLKTGDILLSLTGNVGRVGIVCESDLLLNQRVGLLKPIKEVNRAYTYLLFRGNEMKYKLITNARGTAQANLSPVETENLEVVIPNEKILLEFSAICDPIYNKLIVNNEEILSLKQLRDTLLPKLMSGELRVKS